MAKENGPGPASPSAAVAHLDKMKPGTRHEGAKKPTAVMPKVK